MLLTRAKRCCISLKLLLNSYLKNAINASFFQYFLPSDKTPNLLPGAIWFCLQPQLRISVRMILCLLVAELNRTDLVLTRCITVLERLAQAAEPAL